MGHVGDGVGQRRGRQRPDRPVHPLQLLRLVDGDAEVVRQDVHQPRPSRPAELRGDGRVEQAAHGEAEVTVQAAHVVRRRVQDLGNRRVGQGRAEGRQVGQRQRIEQVHRTVGQRHLDQRHPLGVAVEAVALDIDGQHFAVADRRRDGGPGGGRVDDRRRFGLAQRRSARPSAARLARSAAALSNGTPVMPAASAASMLRRLSSTNTMAAAATPRAAATPA